MKAKFINFIKNCIAILVIVILALIGYIIYNSLINGTLNTGIEEFVSDFLVLGEDTKNSEITEKIDIQENQEISENEVIQDSKHFFYNQLDEYSKIFYNSMEKNKENMKTGTYEINLGSSFSKLLDQSDGEDLISKYFQYAIEAYSYDFPDVFYIDFSKLYMNLETTTRGNSKTYRVFLNSGNEDNYLTNEFSSKEKIDFAVNEIENTKNYIIQNQKQDIYSNIKFVHDYLVENLEYEETISKPNIYNIYGALVNKNCVCEGYAKAFKYLLNSLDINCVLVSGIATNSEGNSENHAWNYVEINNIWYAIDSTWDDPIIIGGFLTKSDKYKYFMKGSVEFNKTHFENGQFSDGGKIFEFPKLSINNY